MPPSGLAGQRTAEVAVSHYGFTSKPFSVAVTEISPALFTFTPGGSNQGAPLNYRFPGSYTPNSAENPAEPGSVVVLFATGSGKWEDDAGLDAAGISLAARPFTAKPISLMIGGQSSRILYAGAAPYQTTSMLQINAYVPEGIGTGPQPVVLSIGGVDNARQMAMIAIK